MHEKHCYQGEYETSCKYGDEDCPARPEVLVKGYSITDFVNGKEMLIAIHPDGRIKRTDYIPITNWFNKKGTAWIDVSPEDEYIDLIRNLIFTADFVGNYEDNMFDE